MKRRTPHYARWYNMHDRCYNPANKCFKHYGARGIKVCAEWDNFRVFQTWCFATFEKGKTIDRVNNDGNYSPDNCRWATASEQTLNARKNTLPQQKARDIRKKALQLWHHNRWGDPKNRTEKYCSRCNNFLAIKFFGKNPAREDGLNVYCVLCSRDYARKYLESNPIYAQLRRDKQREYMRKKRANARLK